MNYCRCVPGAVLRDDVPFRGAQSHSSVGNFRLSQVHYLRTLLQYAATAREDKRKKLAQRYDVIVDKHWFLFSVCQFCMK